MAFRFNYNLFACYLNSTIGYNRRYCAYCRNTGGKHAANYGSNYRNIQQYAPITFNLDTAYIAFANYFLYLLYQVRPCRLKFLYNSPFLALLCL